MFQDQAVLAIVRDTGQIAEHAIEMLIGHPITRKTVQMKVSPQLKQRSRTTRSDPRTIHIIAQQCPKKPGTAAWSLWQLYHEGMTVDEYVNAGGTRAAIRYDSEHGYIRLGGL